MSLSAHLHYIYYQYSIYMYYMYLFSMVVVYLRARERREVRKFVKCLHGLRILKPLFQVCNEFTLLSKVLLNLVHVNLDYTSR